MMGILKTFLIGEEAVVGNNNNIVGRFWWQQNSIINPEGKYNTAIDTVINE